MKGNLSERSWFELNIEKLNVSDVVPKVSVDMFSKFNLDNLSLNRTTTTLIMLWLPGVNIV